LVIALFNATASDIAFFTAPAASAAYSDKSRILLQVETYSRWKSFSSPQLEMFAYWLIHKKEGKGEK